MTEQRPESVRSEEMVSRYEELRMSALSNRGMIPPSRWGLVLLVRQGMASWMTAQLTSGLEPPRGDGRARLDTSARYEIRQSDLVMFLTELVLSRCRELPNA